VGHRAAIAKCAPSARTQVRCCLSDWRQEWRHIARFLVKLEGGDQQQHKPLSVIAAGLSFVNRPIIELPGDAHISEQYVVIVCKQFVEPWIAPTFVLIHRRRANEVPVVFSEWIGYGCALTVVRAAWMVEGSAPCAFGAADRVPIFVLRYFELHDSPSVTLRGR
jgi:hypothetical protein